MHKFIYNLTQKILEIQVKFHQKRLARLHKKMINNSNANLLHDDIELELSIEEEAQKAELNENLKNILAENDNNPEKLLEFIKNSGTDVYRINNVNVFLNFIGEEEGFIPPLNGINAFFLNLFVNLVVYKKFVFSFKSNELFLLRPLPVDIYYMIHQLYLWHGFKMGLSGYDIKNRKKYKKIFATLNDDDISKLALDEIFEIKDAITRDIEAIDFVVNLAKESEASTKLLNRLKSGESVNL